MTKTDSFRNLYSFMLKLIFIFSALLAACFPTFAAEVSGYKIVGKSTIKITIGAAREDGNRLATLLVYSTDDDECGRLLSFSGMWDRICEKIVKDAAGPQTFTGFLYGSGGQLVLTGQLADESEGFKFRTLVLLTDSGEIVSVATHNVRTGSRGYVIMNNNQANYEAVTTSIKSITAVFDGQSFKSKLTLGTLNSDGERSVELTARHLGGSCEVDFGSIVPWVSMCSDASKDGDLSFKGELQQLASQKGTYVGRIVAARTGNEFNIVVSRARANFAVVAVRKNNAPFTQGDNPENIVFDGQSNQADVVPFDLAANDWRVDQENDPVMGAEMEVSFSKVGDDGYTGELITWFGDNPSGYCADTKAMRLICEAAYKDGPLPIIFGIDKAFPGKFRLQGAGSVRPGVGVHWGPFIINVVQGSSIPDWGDEEPDALYIRIVELGVSPGGEPVAWMKLVPLDRPARMVDNDRQLSDVASVSDQPPLPPTPAPAPNPPAPNPIDPDKPNGSTFCEALGLTYSQIGSIDEQNRARQLLLDDGRFGTWKLPTSQLGCEVAGEIFVAGGIKGF